MFAGPARGRGRWPLVSWYRGHSHRRRLAWLAAPPPFSGLLAWEDGPGF